MLKTKLSPLLSFKGHTYVAIDGNAEAPARMWKVTLFTKSEYMAKKPEHREHIRLLRENDQYLIDLHFSNIK
jgi:hypothetical protein